MRIVSSTKKTTSFFSACMLAIAFLCTSIVYAEGTTFVPAHESEWNALTSSEQAALLQKQTEFTHEPELPRSYSVDGTKSCFDYYTFGSVDADVAPTMEQALPGTELPFSGMLKNNNPYPIVDGQVWVKIFKHEDRDEDLLKANGYPLVDFFLAAEHVALPARVSADEPSAQPISFFWKVPESLGEGEYSAAFFVTTSHRYNLLGLTFTDDVTGNTAPFSITAGEEGSEPVAWDKDSVYLNSIPFQFATPPPHVALGEPVVAQATLVNASDEPRVVMVTWITSRWDGILETNELKRESQGYTLAPRAQKQIIYTPPVYETGVTFLQAIVEDGDASSILHIRYVRDGSTDVRINFPGIASFPLKKGEENTIFSCLHAISLGRVEGGSLSLTLKDEDGSVIQSYTYTGDISGSMMGVSESFVPQDNYGKFSLTATLMQNGNVIDESTTVYDCSVIDASTCVSKEKPLSDDGRGFLLSDVMVTTYVAAAGLIIILLLLVFVFLRRKRKTEDVVVTTPEPYDPNI